MARSETFTAGCSKVGSFSYASNFTLYVVLTDRDGNPSTNHSYVDYNVYCQSSGSGSINANHYLYFNINGSDKRNETVKVNVSSPYANIAIASGTIEVNHDGISSIPFSASIQASSYGVSASVSGNFALEYIPRYAEINSVSVQSVGLNTAVIQYSVSRTANIFCRVDGGSYGNPRVYNTTSGTFTISNLTPGQQHSFQILSRAVDANIDRESGVFYATTIDIARITEAPNFTDEESPTIKYTNPFGNNVTTLQACISLTEATDDIAYRDISKTGTSYTFELTDEERGLLRSAATENTLDIKFYIRTDYGQQSYYSYVSKTMSIVNANPIFYNFTYKDINRDIVDNLTGDNQTLIKGYSNIQGTVSVANKAIAQKSATMSKYRLSIDDKTDEVDYSDTEDVSATINGASNNVITMYAIDSRGNSTLKQITASNYINYQKINIGSILVTRVNNVQSETKLKFSGYIWNGNFGLVENSIEECYYRYKKTREDIWSDNITITPTKSSDSFSFESEIVGDLGAIGFDIDESYEIQVFVKDKLSNNYNSPADFILGPGLPAIAIYKNKVAIGHKYDTDLGGVLQITGDVYKNGYLWDGDMYSTDEIPVGIWTDNKKIYRKVFTGNMTNTVGEWTNLFQLDENIDTLINLYGNIKNTKSDKRVIPIPNYESENYFAGLSYLGQTNYVQIFLKGWTYKAFGMVYTIIAEYTKNDS